MLFSVTPGRSDKSILPGSTPERVGRPTPAQAGAVAAADEWAFGVQHVRAAEDGVPVGLDVDPVPT
jgi:hypothetical protein